MILQASLNCYSLAKKKETETIKKYNKQISNRNIMKKIFSTLAIATALFAGYSAYNTQNNNELTDIALANVEALAGSNESDTSRVDCVPDGVECSMIIIFSDGYSGVETIYGKKKAPGWI